MIVDSQNWLFYPDDEIAHKLDGAVRFHLTYEGRLLASGNRSHVENKHHIRRIFHRQLKQLWEFDPRLDYEPVIQGYSLEPASPPPTRRVQEAERRAAFYPSIEDYKFVPLLAEEDDGACVLQVLILRADRSKNLISAGDIDGRVKTLLDALRMPQNKGEIGILPPSGDEKPFFVLLRDDKLIEGLSVEMGNLLQPTGQNWHKKDVRVIVTVKIVPTLGSWTAMRWI